MTSWLMLVVDETLSNNSTYLSGYGRDLPASVVTARDYFSVRNPGAFFRVISPINQVLALAAVVLSWWAPKGTFTLCVAALVLAVSTDIFTFAYFYPRNEIMFVAPIGDVDAVRSALSGWRNMNWIRSGMVVVIIILDYLALLKVVKSE